MKFPKGYFKDVPKRPYTYEEMREIMGKMHKENGTPLPECKILQFPKKEKK